MKLPIIATRAHLGMSLDLDTERETITLISPMGEPLGTLTWESVINQLLSQIAPIPPQETRVQARVALSFTVRYRTPEGNSFEGRAGGMGGGGLFIESNSPLPIETKLSMEFSLPDAPQEWLETKGIVAWICPTSDQYTFSSGMGIQFTEISPELRGRVLELVRSYRRSG